MGGDASLRLIAVPLPAILRPLGDAPVALLWGGLATSAVGDQLFGIVLTWIAVGVLGTAAGYLGALQASATLVAALAIGRWADRREERRIMIAADLARAGVLMLMVAIWLARGTPAAWTLFACVLALASGQALFRPALQATLPALVTEPRMLLATNGLFDSTERIARLLGPGLIALASALLPLWGFVAADAVSFAASALAVTLVARLRPLPFVPPRGRGPFWESVARGFGAAWQRPMLAYSLLEAGPVNGIWYASYFLGLPLLIARDGADATGGLAAFGLVISCYGLTNLAGTLILGSRGLAARPGRLIFGGNVVLAGGTLVLAATPLLLPPGWRLAGYAAGAAIGAIGGPMQDLTMATLRQTALPRGDIAPVVRAFMVASNLGLLVALLGAPSLFDRVGVALAMLGGNVVLLALGVFGVLRYGRLDQAQAAAVR